MSIKQKNFVSAVVYIRNNAGTIDSFLIMLHSILSGNFEKFEIICVNDASTDDSKEIVKNLAQSTSNCMLSIVNMSYYQGVESAMRAGVDLAIGDFAFEFDEAVLDFEPELIMRVYNRLLQGFDIVSCGRGNLRASSKLFYSIYNRHSGTQYALKSETFRIVSRRAINRVYSMSTNMPYRKAMYSNCGLKLDYISYKPTIDDAKYKQVLKDPHDTALTSLILFTNIAYKVSLFFTFAMMTAAIASVAYVVMVYLTGNPVEGYTTMMILISGAFFALFAILAVVIKYLSVISGLVFHKQRYMIESIEKIAG